MTIKQIKVGLWYHTTVGVGQVQQVGGTHPPSVKINITHPFPRGVLFVKPRDVREQVPEPEAAQ